MGSFYFYKMTKQIRKLFKILKPVVSKTPWLALILVIAVLGKNHVNASAEPAVADVYSFSNYLEVKKQTPEIKMVLGESESDKRERAQLIAKNTPKASSKAAVSSAPAVELTFDQKRNLAKEAASSVGIRFELLEAVWQVETGKGTVCVKNASGATGPFQFLPSTFRAYAPAGSDICNVRDAAFAAARLLANAGADAGDEFGALLHYNHSSSYANKVLAIANSI